MFSARRRVPVNRLYIKDNLEGLGSDLLEAGFDNIIVKLPHNLVGMNNCEISLSDFLDRERNYPSVVLAAMNSERRETIKILFVNISRKAFFVDDTFPSGHSENSELFVQSPDPARVYALSGFFSDYFQSIGRKTWSVPRFFLYLGALVLLIAELLSVVAGKGFVSSLYPSFGFGPLMDLILGALAIYIVFISHRTLKGLYVNPPPKRSIWSLANRAARGQVMDNPLVALIVTIVGGLIVGFILKVLGIL